MSSRTPHYHPLPQHHTCVTTSIPRGAEQVNFSKAESSQNSTIIAHAESKARDAFKYPQSNLVSQWSTVSSPRSLVHLASITFILYQILIVSRDNRYVIQRKEQPVELLARSLPLSLWSIVVQQAKIPIFNALSAKKRLHPQLCYITSASYWSW